MANLVNKGELSGFNSAISTINQSAQSCNSVDSIIESFKNNGGILRGELWQTEGQKMETLMTALDKSKAAASLLSSAIASSINDLLAVWDSRFGDDVSDTYRDEVYANLVEARRNLEICQAYLDSLPDDSPHLASARAARDAAAAVVAELESLLAAIDAFLAVYNTVISNLDSVASDLDANFGSCVKGITATAPWNFKPY